MSVFISFRFFGSNLRILPVRNNAEIVKGMLTIAKVNKKAVHKGYLVIINKKLDMLLFPCDALK